MFIKLHENNKCEYINFDKVTNMHISNGKTCIFTETSREYFEVRETPEEIMALFNEHKMNDLDTINDMLRDRFYDLSANLKSMLT